MRSPLCSQLVLSFLKKPRVAKANNCESPCQSGRNRMASKRREVPYFTYSGSKTSLEAWRKKSDYVPGEYSILWTMMKNNEEFRQQIYETDFIPAVKESIFTRARQQITFTYEPEAFVQYTTEHDEDFHRDIREKAIHLQHYYIHNPDADMRAAIAQRLIANTHSIWGYEITPDIVEVLFAFQGTGRQPVPEMTLTNEDLAALISHCLGLPQFVNRYSAATFANIVDLHRQPWEMAISWSQENRSTAQ